MRRQIVPQARWPVIASPALLLAQTTNLTHQSLDDFLLARNLGV